FYYSGFLIHIAIEGGGHETGGDEQGRAQKSSTAALWLVRASAFVACLDNIDKEHDLQSGAKCLVKAFDKQLVKSYPYALHRPYYDFVGVNMNPRGGQKKKKQIRKAVKDFAKARAAKLLKLNFKKKIELKKGTPTRLKTKSSSKRHGTSKAKKNLKKTEKVVRKRFRRTKRNVLSLYSNLQDRVSESKRSALFKHRMLDMSVFDLVDTVSKHTKDINRQFLSPRILPLLPDKYSVKNVLPIPEVLEKSGLDSNDRESVLELLMDVTGVNEVVEKSMNLLKGIKEVGLDGDLATITAMIDRGFDELNRSLQKNQRRDLATRQYSFLTKAQMAKLFDPMTVGNPLIFSPYVVGPNVLSAAVFNAYVFSPYVLSPNVINPYVLSPLILSPYVLCPDVVSPTILSGVVLSPSVLSPSVFTESALSINVLSPSVLS
ncbi:unnamed protein product, partial [Nippostrongylus brasiliensis]|uniref:Ribosomal_L23eN domain-containing protein n=1 Tax=Nippostrongylus brasiliensis TaxID=27835 RepID=A0A158QYE0_NIPBR